MKEIGGANNMLVSIVLITYNSSKYVIEALNSILNQTYSNIELIISDDCSSDKTIQICDSWKKKNSQRFKRIEIIKAVSNTGVSANLNRSIKESRGDWIKLIAGDDLLAKKCIEQYVNFVKSNDCNFVGADFKSFPQRNNNRKKMLYEKCTLDFYNNLTNNEQLELVLRGGGYVPNHITWFYNRNAIMNVGLYDENIPMMEDQSLKINVLKHGYKIEYLPSITYLYRVHASSISHSKENKIVSNWYFNTFLEVRKKYFKPYFKDFELLLFNYDIFTTSFFHKTIFNTPNLFNRSLFFIIKRPVVKYKSYKLKKITTRIKNGQKLILN